MVVIKSPIVNKTIINIKLLKDTNDFYIPLYLHKNIYKLLS